MHRITFSHTFENIKRCRSCFLDLLVTVVEKGTKQQLSPYAAFAKACAKAGEQKRFKFWGRAKALWRGDLVFEKASISLINQRTVQCAVPHLRPIWCANHIHPLL